MAKRCYVSGKMRGEKQFGFPLFDAARDMLRLKGWSVVSPADLDRAIGFDPNNDDGYDFDICEALRRDTQALLFVDAIVLLPNWKESVGARYELCVAQAIGVPALAINMKTGRLTKIREKVEAAIVGGR